MAVTDLGSLNQFANSQTISITSAAAVSAGTLVVVFALDGNSSIVGATVTDSKSNAYTLIAGGQFGGGTSNMLMFYSFVTTPLTTSDTITYTTNAGFTTTTMDISASSVPGYNAIDGATTNTSNNGFSASYSVTGAGTAAVANEINFAFVTTFGTFTGTPSGWTTNPPSSPEAPFLAAWQINAGTAPLTFAGTLTGAQWAAVIIASFKPGGGGPVSGIIVLTGMASAEW